VSSSSCSLISAKCWNPNRENIYQWEEELMGWGFLYDCIFSSKLFVFFLRSNSRYSWSRLIRIEPNA
jgi:hypothetical protein